MPMSEPQTVILNVSVLPWQREMVAQYMRDHGLLSMAEATRAILTEFRDRVLRYNNVEMTQKYVAEVAE